MWSTLGMIVCDAISYASAFAALQCCYVATIPHFTDDYDVDAKCMLATDHPYSSGVTDQHHVAPVRVHDTVNTAMKLYKLTLQYILPLFIHSPQKRWYIVTTQLSTVSTRSMNWIVILGGTLKLGGLFRLTSLTDLFFQTLIAY